MRLAYLLLPALVAGGGCFHPDFAEGSPCSAEELCPGDQSCVLGMCFRTQSTEECNGRVTISYTSDLACGNRDTVLTATAGANYKWSTGETSRSIRTRLAGTYKVAVDGCESTEMVLVDKTPTITVDGPPAICYQHGETTVLTASVSDDYLWSTGETTRSIVVDQPGMYTVSTSPCFTSAPVEVRALPAATVTAGCSGTQLQLTASGGQSFAWSNGAATRTISVFTAGPYQVTIDGCATSPLFVVTPEQVRASPAVFNFTGAPASFEVPACVSSLTIEAKGGQGGGGAGGTPVADGGKGAREVGTFTVTPGEKLNVVVGGLGANGDCFVSTGRSGGGGGGSFAWRATETALPLIAAAGGGGSATVPSGANGCDRVGRPGQAASATGLALSGIGTLGGAAGNDGLGGGKGTGTPGDAAGAGGGGWLGAGVNSASTNGGHAGAGIAGDFAGGVSSINGHGGFGGGGAGYCSGGGGGGFSGGGAGEGSFSTFFYCGGGGGGSLNRGTATVSEAGIRTGAGQVVFTW